jgi:branched-subunit amino acid ABC-type transport system permease component
MLQHVFNGLVGGSFLALVALGLAVIFGMLRVVNFAHGALYMLGAFGALWLGGSHFWLALLLVPIALAVVGMLLERTLIHRLSKLDPLYNFLLTFGLTLVFQDLVKWRFGVQSSPYPVPSPVEGHGRLRGVRLPRVPRLRAGDRGGGVRRRMVPALPHPGGNGRPGRHRTARAHQQRSASTWAGG